VAGGPLRARLFCGAGSGSVKFDACWNGEQARGCGDHLWPSCIRFRVSRRRLARDVENKRIV